MIENFEQLLNESLENTSFNKNSLISAVVTQVRPESVIVSAGMKADVPIPKFEFMDGKGQLEINVGDLIDVVVVTPENGFGEPKLSRERARRAAAWQSLYDAFENNENIVGVVTERVKGGFAVMISSIKAFLPGSLVDMRPVRDPACLEGQELEFKLIKLDQKRNNIVVSRRAVVEQETSVERKEFLENLDEGQIVKGVVKNLTDYGAFVDLGGIDGLLHITDMSWKRIKHPSEILKVGDEIDVAILKFDREKNRVSLGMKQTGDDPWAAIINQYPVGSRAKGRVTNLTDYGCFVEIEDGVEGLVHMSEMDWTNKNIHPSKVVQLGGEVDVMVLEVDQSRRRISLGIKQCTENPWQVYASAHKEGDRVKGQVRSITDFGLFVGLQGNIDGLIHMSDISWAMNEEEAIRSYKKGDEVEAIILSVDSERERISLGIKQLDEDPMTDFSDGHPKGSLAKGKVTHLDAKGATLDLGDDLTGYIKASDISVGNIKDAREYLTIDEEVEAQVTGFDRKSRMVALSIKALQRSNMTADAPESSTLGDLFKDQLQGKDKA